MSWLFSRALVEASLGGIFSDGGLSAPSSATPTPQAFSWLAKTTGASRRSRSGMTCAPLTADRGEAVLTFCLAASPVRTFPAPAREQASPASAPACGPKWRGSSVRWDHDSSSWKTVPSSPGAVSTSFSGTWPRWGTMRAGVCSERVTPARPTSASGSGSWPTPNKMDAFNGPLMCDPEHWRKRAMQKLEQGICLQFPLRIAVQMWQIPEAGIPVAAPHPQILRTWPTPNARDWKGPPGAGCVARGGRSHSLPLAVQMWPIPMAHDGKDCGSSPSQVGRNSPTLPVAAGGKLNPTWVEWLMGWPLGWTDLRASAMDRFQQWRRSHGVV